MTSNHKDLLNTIASESSVDNVIGDLETIVPQYVQDWKAAN